MTDAPAQLFPDPFWAKHRIEVDGHLDGAEFGAVLRLVSYANPFGGTEARLVGPPPRGREHTSDRLAAAIRVAAYWFSVIGNVDRIDRPMLAHVIQRLKEYPHGADSAERRMLVAIREYARSEWHRKGKRWMSHKVFFKDDAAIALWSKRSPEWQAHVKRTKVTGPLLGRRTPAGACPPARECLSPSTPSLCPPVPSSLPSSPMALTDADLRAAYRQVLADRAAHAAALQVWSAQRDEVWARAYDLLGEHERRQLYVEVERETARGRYRADGTAAIDADSDEFRRELHRRAWLVCRDGRMGASRQLRIPEPPRAASPSCGTGFPAGQQFAPDDLEREVRRRALAGFRQPSVRRTDAIAAAEQQLITEWLREGEAPAEPCAEATS